ncbi:MAG: MFS transporter [Chloroflexi bacterium]|nr:MFS transporter [Chloroflexota bacterium]
MSFESLAPLRYRNFRLIWSAQLISAGGMQMQRAVILWHIYKLTDNVSMAAIALGLIALFRALPAILFSMIGGVIADARDRRRVLLITQSAMMLIAAGLALSTFMGVVSVPLIYLAVFLTGAAGSFDGPARQSMVATLVPPRYLANAFSLNSVMAEVGYIAGPGIGGLLIGLLGTEGIAYIYVIIAASFLAIIVALTLMAPLPVAAEPLRFGDGAAGARQFVAALVEGVQFMRRSPVVMWAMLTDFFANFFASANTLMPIFADQYLKVGPQGYGLLLAAPSIGSISAAIIMSLRPVRHNPGRIILAGVLLFGLATTLFGLSVLVEPLMRAVGGPLVILGVPVAFVFALVTFGLTGTGDTISMILRQTVRQLATPDRLRGRMTAINTMFAMGGPQLGDLEAGIVASLWGTPFAIVSGGIGCLLAVLVVLRWGGPLVNYDGAHLRAPHAEDAPPPAPAAAPAGE